MGDPWSSVELLPGLVGPAEEPVGWRDVVGRDFAAVVGAEPEREAPAVEVGGALPLRAPVPAQGHPARVGALDPCLRYHAGAAHVGDEHELEVVVAVDGEPHAASPGARHPLVHHRDDAGAVDADLLPRRLRHVEVLPRRVAPAAVVAGLGVVRRAQVGRRHGHRHAPLAPLPAVLGVARHLVALPARRAVVEQRRAQRRRVRPVPRRVQVAVPASAAWL
jgi:hypothetical protein